MKLRAFDLFCGAGGCSCGARMAGVIPVGGIDVWDTAVKTFAFNFPKGKAYHQSIMKLSAAAVAREVGHIDLLLASLTATSFAECVVWPASRIRH